MWALLAGKVEMMWALDAQAGREPLSC